MKIKGIKYIIISFQYKEILSNINYIHIVMENIDTLVKVDNKKKILLQEIRKT